MVLTNLLYSVALDMLAFLSALSCFARLALRILITHFFLQYVLMCNFTRFHLQERLIRPASPLRSVARKHFTICFALSPYVVFSRTTNQNSPSLDFTHNVSPLPASCSQVGQVNALHQMKQGNPVPFSQLAFLLSETGNKFAITSRPFCFVDPVSVFRRL
jgi:hypothetical protein